MRNEDITIDNSVNDGISCVAFGNNNDFLTASCWDGRVLVYSLESGNNGSCSGSRQHSCAQHQAPVLSVCVAGNNQICSAGLDKKVMMWDVERGPDAVKQIGAHDAAVRHVRSMNDLGLIASGGWDGHLKFWDTRTDRPTMDLNHDERVYAMDCKDNIAVVCLADKSIHVYDIRKQENLSQFTVQIGQMRCCSIFADGRGFCVGTTIAKVSIEYFEELGRDRSVRNASFKSFTYKCHRDERTSRVFAINDISFNSAFNSFSTAGSDGTISFWDKESRNMIKSLENNKFKHTISCGAFSNSSQLFAYGVSYDWSQGAEKESQFRGNTLMLHNVMEEDINYSLQTRRGN